MAEIIIIPAEKASTKARVLKIKDKNAAFADKGTAIANAFLEYYRQLYTPQTQDINTGRTI